MSYIVAANHVTYVPVGVRDFCVTHANEQIISLCPAYFFALAEIFSAHVQRCCSIVNVCCKFTLIYLRGMSRLCYEHDVRPSVRLSVCL